MAILNCIIPSTDSLQPKKKRKLSTRPSTEYLLVEVQNEVSTYFKLLNLTDYDKNAHEKKYAPYKQGGRERDNSTRYSFWPSNRSNLPLLYVSAHAILLGPGSSISCERLNSAALLLITVLRNRLKDNNKENLLLAKRAAREWDFDSEELIADLADSNDISFFTNDDDDNSSRGDMNDSSCDIQYD